jgi:signal peptidase I
VTYLRRAGSLLGTLLLAILAATTIANAVGWVRITPVLSGSMRGAFNPGDALLTQRVPASSLRVGDVVVVKVPAKAGQPTRAHRIVNIRERGSAVAIRTKGDANTATDPGSILLRGDQYRMRARLPYVGWIVDFKAQNGMRLLVEAIAMILWISVAQRIWQSARSTSSFPRRHRSNTAAAIAS